MADPLGVAITGALVSGVGALIVAGARLRSREIASTPKTTCAEALGAPDGREVKLNAVARCDAPLVSPLTRTPCVYYLLELHEVVSHSRGATSVITLASTTEWADWYLEDATGALPVDPERAEVRPLATGGASCSAITAKPHPLFASYGVEPSFGPTYELREKCVPVGAPLFARGRLQHGILGGRDLLVSTASEGKLRASDWGLVALGGLIAVAGAIIATFAFQISCDQATRETSLDRPTQNRLRTFQER